MSRWRPVLGDLRTRVEIAPHWIEQKSSLEVAEEERLDNVSQRPEKAQSNIDCIAASCKDIEQLLISMHVRMFVLHRD